ncbi:MAG: leucine-rich repeat domain-containing protein [Ruminococcaceae bacterium]|nr:leucine-rich repeat domain-containing protein [Oscillospiraceae bacterium]
MKKIASLLLSLLMVFALLPFAAFSVNAEALDAIYVDAQGVEYTLGEDGTYYAVTSFDESVTSVVLLDSINGIPVDEISNGAFLLCTELESIEIPDSVIYIDDNAFYDCDALTSVEIPDSVFYIGSEAFSDCDNLESVKLSNTLSSIGYNTFSWNLNLKNIEIPDSVYAIDDYAFWKCESLTEIEIPNSVVYIGWGAFDGCIGLTSVSIPNSVEYLSCEVFKDCTNLTDIYCEAESQPENWAVEYEDEDGYAYTDWNYGCDAEIHWGIDMGNSNPSTPTDDEIEPDPDLPITPVKPARKGDIDGDDDIDSMDYLYLKRVYFSQYALPGLAVGDIDNDGEITSMDYLYLKRAYFSQYVITNPNAAVAGKYMILSIASPEGVIDYETLYLLGLTDICVQFNEDGTASMSILGDEATSGTFDVTTGVINYVDGSIEYFTVDGDILTIFTEDGNSMCFTKGELPEINPDDFEDIGGDEEIEYPDIPLMTHEEYLAAEDGECVYIEAYVQGYVNYGEGYIYVYCQNAEGGYYIYEAACTDEDLEKIDIGTKIRVKGYKYNYSGSLEIEDGLLEVIDDGDTYIAEPIEANDLLSTDELLKHQGKLVSLKGMTVEEIFFLDVEYGGDIVVILSYNGNPYEFYITLDLNGFNPDAYDTACNLEVGDVVDVVGFANWYDVFYAAVTDLAIAE